ncbi:MAG: elongation factor Ts [Xanthomonadales bacterium]|jgi:elongation factor Ts|nr:elongation factor Ts [Gammaproteobacteria bacterium]MBT8064339.1 elongation factor Ts [Gammaproteobacteria bacterium]NNK33705.1 elongation factor Ts [Xanthomonadales bacterium]NNK37357.1 elongation factor Ts [Xanthomonadales bacterium]
MAVTAALVKELRERTGAGMMECKKALVETGGDMDAAIEALRKSGLAQADKKASRVAAEGKIALAVSDDRSEAVMVEVNCETDFVAKDDSFNAFADAVARNALDSDPADVEELMNTRIGEETVEQARQALVSKIGENIQVRRFVRARADNPLGAYIHGGKIGVLVDISGGDAELAHDLAMHVAAMNPEFVSDEDVPADVIAREKDILVAQAESSGKPPEIIEKMVTGRLRKHLAGITLLGQPFVKDSDLTVAKLLSQGGARVNGFDRLAVGEGIEKKEENFAEEVMQQVTGG